MLLRKNLMIDENIWKACEVLSDIKKISISKLVNELLGNEIQKEQETNVALRIKMALGSVECVSDEEESDIMKSLSEMKPEDLEIVAEDEI